MPIYEYECTKCSERFEVLQKISEGNEGLRCPRCDAEAPRRVVSAFCSGGKGAGQGSSAPHGSAGHS